MNQNQIIVTIIAVIVIGLILVIYLTILKRNGWLDRSDPNEPLNSNQQILENNQRLLDFIQKTNENFPTLYARINKIQADVEKLQTETSKNNGIDVDSFRKMETKIAEISEEITKLNKVIYVNIKECFDEIVNFIDRKKTEQVIRSF